MRNIFGNKHFIVLFGNGLISLLGLGMMYIIMHHMSLAHAGTWFLLQSFVGLCEASRGGLLATATVKFYAGTDKSRAEIVLGSVWFLSLAFSAILLGINGLALFYLPFTHSYEIALYIKWIGINYLSSLPSDIVFWRLQADEKYAKMYFFRLINSGSTIASFIILVMLNQFTLENVILWNVITNCLSSLAGLIWFRSGIQYITRRTKECVSEIFHYGKYTFGTTLFSNLLGNANIWIVSFVLGPASVAIFQLAVKLMALIDVPMRAFATIAMPEMAIANNTGNKELVGYVFKKYAGMITMAFLPFAIIACFVGTIPIHILGGHQLDGASGDLAVNIFRFTMILALASPIDQFNGIALDITHHTKINFYKMIIVIASRIIIGLAATELLNSLYGIIIGNYTAMIISILYGYYQLRKYISHTITGVISIGYKELILYLKRKAKFSEG